MFEGDRLRILATMFVAVVVLAGGETALSKGMKTLAPETSGIVAVISAGLRSPWLWTGVLLLVLHLALYLVVLSEADLSFALPLTAASYPLSALLARFVLHENVGYARWTGTALITIGVAIVAFCDSPTRTEP